MRSKGELISVAQSHFCCKGGGRGGGSEGGKTQMSQNDAAPKAQRQPVKRRNSSSFAKTTQRLSEYAFNAGVLGREVDRSSEVPYGIKRLLERTAAVNLQGTRDALLKSGSWDDLDDNLTDLLS